MSYSDAQNIQNINSGHFNEHGKTERDPDSPVRTTGHKKTERETGSSVRTTGHKKTERDPGSSVRTTGHKKTERETGSSKSISTISIVYRIYLTLF